MSKFRGSIERCPRFAGAVNRIRKFTGMLMHDEVLLPDVPVTPDIPDTPTGDPVAYLFNGMPLPPVPEEAKTFHYLMITNQASVMLYCYSKEPVLKVSSGTKSAYAPGATCRYYVLGEGETILGVMHGKWGYVNEFTMTNTFGSNPNWVNFDIKLQDSGEVYMYGTEPVPVYE